MSPNQIRFLATSTAAIIIALGLTGCPSQGTPGTTPSATSFTQTLATACNGLASAYATAAGYRAQGKLSASAVNQLRAIEKPALTLCSPTNPPADAQAAITQVTAYAQQMALINAGVKP